MNQQEIKNNLPELPLQNEDRNVLDHNGEYILSVSAHGYTVETDKATEAAITHAINNTYGKGINPDSVPDMFNGLGIAIGAIEAIGDTVTAQILKDILNKATL